MSIRDNFSTHVLDSEGQIHAVDFFSHLKVRCVLHATSPQQPEKRRNPHQVFQLSHFLRAEAGFIQSCDCSYCF